MKLTSALILASFFYLSTLNGQEFYDPPQIRKGIKSTIEEVEDINGNFVSTKTQKFNKNGQPTLIDKKYVSESSGPTKGKIIHKRVEYQYPSDSLYQVIYYRGIDKLDLKKIKQMKRKRKKKSVKKSVRKTMPKVGTSMI